MCLIIHKRPKANVPTWLLESASEANPDGLGIAWRDSRDSKRFHTFRTVCSSWSDQLEVASLLLRHIGDESEVIMHFRMRTQGSVNTENCHPFTIDCRYGKWLLFHNGHFTGFGDSHKSDTREFAELILSPILWHYEVLTSQVKTAMEKLFLGNRVLLISPIGEIYRFPEAWHKISEGLLLSNMYAWRYPTKNKRKGFEFMCEVDNELVLGKKHKKEEEDYYVINKLYP